MKTYEGFISNIKDKIKNVTKSSVSNKYISDMVSAKFELITLYRKNIHDFFIEKNLGDIKIYVRILGYTITISKNMDMNTYVETHDRNLDIDITDIYEKVQKHLYSLSDDDIENIKINQKIEEYDI